MMIDQPKPRLKIGFVDYFEGLDKFFVWTFSKRYEVIRDDDNPDYLIFCDRNFGCENVLYNNKKNIKIFYTGENVRPDPSQYQFHNAITFDHMAEPWQYRLPLYVIDHWMMVYMHHMPFISAIETEKSVTDIKTRFCGFVSGNPNCQKRNELFQQISSYKKVDSAGPLFNNVPLIPRGLEAAKNKYNFLKEYKFNLCPENSSYPGYLTEKLFHAFYCKTIPIYWGDPTAAMSFNPKAFINWHEYKSDKILLDRIKELDNNESMYFDMYMQPIFNPFDETMNMHRFLDWFHTNVYKGVL